MTKILLLVLMVASASMATASAQGSGEPAGSAVTGKSITLPNIPVELKEGPGRATVEKYCTMCHSTDYIVMQPRFPQAQWTATVNKMIKTYGAPVPQPEAGEIADYITRHYGQGK